MNPEFPGCVDGEMEPERTGNSAEYCGDFTPSCDEVGVASGDTPVLCWCSGHNLELRRDSMSDACSTGQPADVLVTLVPQAHPMSDGFCL